VLIKNEEVVALADELSVTRIAIDAETEVVGVPEMSPVFASSARPAGSDPEARVN
jgi:hypothetical protein